MVMIKSFLHHTISVFIFLLGGIAILGVITSMYVALTNHKGDENKGFLRCYFDKGVILSKYGDVKFDGNTWTILGKSFTYKTNSKCLFIKDMKS